MLDIKAAVSPFLFLAVDLPPPPLFQDTIEKNIIPQVSIHSVLAKYDGVTTQVSLAAFIPFSHIIRVCRSQLVNYVGINANAFHSTSSYTTSASQRTPSSRRKTRPLSHFH